MPSVSPSPSPSPTVTLLHDIVVKVASGGTDWWMFGAIMLGSVGSLALAYRAFRSSERADKAKAAADAVTNAFYQQANQVRSEMDLEQQEDLLSQLPDQLEWFVDPPTPGAWTNAAYKIQKALTVVPDDELLLVRELAGLPRLDRDGNQRPNGRPPIPEGVEVDGLAFYERMRADKAKTELDLYRSRLAVRIQENKARRWEAEGKGEYVGPPDYM